MDADCPPWVAPLHSLFTAAPPPSLSLCHYLRQHHFSPELCELYPHTCPAWINRVLAFWFTAIPPPLPPSLCRTVAIANGAVLCKRDTYTQLWYVSQISSQFRSALPTFACSATDKSALYSSPRGPSGIDAKTMQLSVLGNSLSPAASAKTLHCQIIEASRNWT